MRIIETQSWNLKFNHKQVVQWVIRRNYGSRNRIPKIEKKKYIHLGNFRKSKKIEIVLRLIISLGLVDFTMVSSLIFNFSTWARCIVFFRKYCPSMSKLFSVLQWDITVLFSLVLSGIVNKSLLSYQLVAKIFPHISKSE